MKRMSDEVLKICGGIPLQGHVPCAGAKNAITKLLVASLLTTQKCTFYRVPNIRDVEITVDLCKEIGSSVSWNRDDGILEIQTESLTSTFIPERFSGANRIPILLIGALLGRTDQPIVVPTAGGCNIGARPVDFHIQALQKLGATVERHESDEGKAYFAQCKGRLQGAEIHLPFPSVGATENALLAASRAKGITVIRNAAIEPEIIDLILFLQKLGVVISVEVDRSIRIESTEHFHAAEHTVIPDRIEAASLGMAAIASKGRVFVEGARQDHLVPFLNQLRALGGGFEVKEKGIEFFYEGPLQGGLHIETGVHPGFLTDWQQPFVVLLTQARGTSVVHETIYENRFGYARTLQEMGADILISTDCVGEKPCRFAAEGHEHSVIVKGPTPLVGREIEIPDLRAGFAYVLAALIAEEESILTGLHYLDRGYANLTEKLSMLGAEVERKSEVTFSGVS
jgi:UDP-N-acetylglucosamine 1-carboxyvinyltransferase